jgi:hypothetical protein
VTPQVVMAGLVPAISMRAAQCPAHRDHRDKPGDDTLPAGWIYQ